MHSAALVAEERSLEMNAQRAGMRRIRGRFFRRGFDGVGQSAERSAGGIERGGNRGGEISGDAVIGEELAQTRQFRWHGAHEIESGAAVYVDIHKARGQR